MRKVTGWRSYPDFPDIVEQSFGGPEIINQSNLEIRTSIAARIISFIKTGPQNLSFSLFKPSNSRWKNRKERPNESTTTEIGPTGLIVTESESV